MKLLVSSCLMGMSCRYDGNSNVLPQLKQLMRRYTCIPVCAEIFGGLPIPRPPAERRGNKIVTVHGDDVTEAYIRGTAEILRLAEIYRCDTALLKEHSPACGSGMIYDGNFTGELVPGDGILAQLLKKNGFTIYGESQISELLDEHPFYSI